VTAFLLLLHIALFVALAARVLLRNDLAPDVRMAWLMVGLLLPYVGAVLYFLLGEAALSRGAAGRHLKLSDFVRQRLAGDEAAQRALGSPAEIDALIAPRWQGVSRYAASINGFQPVAGNRAELMSDGDSARARLLADLDAAEHEINVLYYIWLGDHTGTEVARALMREGHAGPESPADSRSTRFFGRVLAPFLRSGRRRWALLAGILAALALSLLLAAFPNARLGVVLKMLPFDNKSEFQVVLDMPAGTPLEDTAAALQALSGHLAGQPEVIAVQGYAGTASPITFNGLVRQYDLRELPEQGDLQVTLVDKHHRHEQSHAIAQRLRPSLEKLAQGFGARVSVVEVPPGPPVQAPIVAEVYGPDEAGRQALAARLTRAFADTAGIVGVDNTLKADAPRAFLRVNRVRAESLGIPVATIAQTLAAALSGQDATYLHDGHDKRATPVRVQLPLEAQAGLDALLAMPLRAASGALVPLSELVRVDKGVIDKPLYTKDLLALSAVTGDVGGGAGEV
jgi:multidrug efflux pump subunit AcrB